MTTVAAPVRTPAVTSDRDSNIRLGATVALWLGLLLVTYWWVADGGVGQLTGWTSGLTSAGRITGLLSSDLLLVQVLLMARLPVLERAFGQDDLVRRHRIVGFTSFTLMLAHIVLISLGYAAGSLAALPGELWTLTVDYPGMLLAVAGTAFLVLVVVTSVKAARRKLRYESWHLLHLYAYLGVGLALPHQLWTGQQFLTSPAATVYWWTLWAAAAGAILIWRLGVPLVRNLRLKLRVTSVVNEGDGVVSVYVTGRKLHLLDAQAGQFLTWRFLTRGWTRGHPYSLSAAPDGRSLRISVKALGDGSAAVRRLRPGTRALVEGPFGRLTERVRTRRRVAMIGAGVGVAPLRALAEGLDYRPGEAVLLHRFTDWPLFHRELRALADERGLEVIELPGHRRSDDSWLGGVVASDDVSVLQFWVPDIAERDVYVCGPDAWSDAVRRAAEGAGVPEDNIHIEHFKW